MSEISDVSELSGEPITEAILWGYANNILLTLNNLITGNGTYGAVDETENGPSGSSAFPSRTIAELRREHARIMDLLAHPELWDTSEVRIYMSQWDNPAL